MQRQCDSKISKAIAIPVDNIDYSQIETETGGALYISRNLSLTKRSMFPGFK